MITPTPADVMKLGCLVLDDAVDAARDSDDFSLQLDLALGLMERQRAGGPEGGPAQHLARAVELIRERPDVGPRLFGGVGRLGWLASRLSEQGHLKATNAGWIDDYVLSSAEHYPDWLDVDLPQGIVGLGVYGLGRPSPAVREAISVAVLRVIEDRAESDGDGAFIRRVNPRRVQVSPGYVLGHRDLGVAHGSLGVVAYLAAVAGSGLPSAERARRLLEPLVRWLLSVVIPDDDTAVFGVTAERRWQATRTAWCYGDPGAAVALTQAADALGDPALAGAARHQAHRAAVASLSRPPERAGVVDACLCHGAAGLCYYGRSWSTGAGLDSVGFTERWYTWIQDHRARGRLLYRGAEGTGPHASFLEGDCGVAAALFYLASGVPPAWEELLLMARPTVD